MLLHLLLLRFGKPGYVSRHLVELVRLELRRVQVSARDGLHFVAQLVLLRHLIRKRPHGPRSLFWLVDLLVGDEHHWIYRGNGPEVRKTL